MTSWGEYLQPTDVGDEITADLVRKRDRAILRGETAVIYTISIGICALVFVAVGYLALGIVAPDRAVRVAAVTSGALSIAGLGQVLNKKARAWLQRRADGGSHER